MIPLESALRWFAAALDVNVLAGVLLRVTLIAAIAHLMLASLPRAAAAVRHLVAATALAACVLLPIAALGMPAWRLPLLPAPRPGFLTTPRAGEPAPAASPAPAGAPRISASPVAPAALRSDAPLAAVSQPGAISSPARPRSALPWASLLAAALAIVSLLLLARIAALMLLARLVHSRAARIVDERVLMEFARAARGLGLEDAGEVRVSSRVTVPVVTGVFSGGLLLPIPAMSWPQDRLRAVFLHELAHVRRGDGLASLIQRSAAALFWFHPLVVALARSARRDCERACDDMVLDRGVRPSDYARHLLEIARGAAGGGFAGLTLAFARRSTLESRLIAILKDDLRRAPISRRAVATAAALALFVTLPIASLRVVAAPAPIGEKRAPVTGLTSATSTVSTTSVVTRSETRMETHTTESSSPAAPPKDELLAHRPWSDGKTDDENSYDRAKSLYDAQRYDEAGTLYERAAVAGIKTGTAWYNAACSFSLDGQRNRAVGDLVAALDAGFSQTELLQTDTDLNAIRTDKRFQLILKGLASTDASMEQRNEAVTEYQRLKSENSVDAGAWKSVSISLMRSGETDKSVDGFARQFAIDSSASAAYNKACALALGGRTDPALDALERSIVAGYDDAGHIEQDPDLASLHSSKRFDEVVQLAKDLELNGMGLDYDDPAKWREAGARYERVAREHPTLGRAWFNLGFAQLRAKDPKSSRDSYLHALNLGYRVGPTCYNLACATAQLGETDTAIAWLQRSEAAGLDVASLAKGDRDLDALRADPRFRKMMDEYDKEVATRKGSKHKKS